MQKTQLRYVCSTLIFLSTVVFAYIGAEWNPTGDPIGGGPGYSDSVVSWDYYVSSKSQLLSALAGADAGDVVYVDDNAEIDLTGVMLTIPRGITLASGRGRTLSDSISWGGLLYCTEHERSMELVFVNAKHIRITGLRMRGGFSQLEGQQVETDTFTQPLPFSYYGIWIRDDSVEVDNCEIWGFPGAPIAGKNCREVDIHHNYFHDGNHCYHAYGVNFMDNTTYHNTANFTDYCQWLIMSGGGDCMATRGYHSWCIFGHHVFGASFYAHGAYGYDSCAFDSIYNCSFYTTGYTYNWKSGYSLPHPARDIPVVRNSWFKNDSAKSIDLGSGATAHLINNWYSEVPPSGVEDRIPVASIACTVDSDTVPLTVAFDAMGSYDPDGQIIAYYWNFGDSLKPDNYARYTDNRTVSHTYNQIGRYLVELMVVDDHGVMNYAYKTINVVPDDNKAWLSCWIKDRYYDRVTGYYKKQILIDNSVCWEKDIAGNGSWEHVVLDVTDKLDGKDSVDLAFRLQCVQNTSNYWQPMVYVDDVMLYGANVVNGDFESGPWTGSVYSRTDGYWQSSRNGTQYIYVIDFEMDVHSGKRAFFLGTQWNPHYQGDWGKVQQTVAVGNSAGSSYFELEGSKDYSMSLPYPNPSRRSPMMDYGVPTKTRVLIKIYDICGRLVRTLVDEVQGAGPYRINWDTRDNHGTLVSSGVYFCRLHAVNESVSDSYVATQSLVVIR